MLFPEEEAARSKTGEFDNSIPLDLGRQEWLGRVLLRYKAHCNRNPKGKVVCIDYNIFRKNLAGACSALGVDVLGITAHSFRHSGPSYDRACQLRDLFGICQRGRWRCGDRNLAPREAGGGGGGGGGV